MLELLLLGCMTLASAEDDLFKEKLPDADVYGARFANFIQGGSYFPGTSELRWNRRERVDDSATGWHETSAKYSTRYKIVDATCRMGGDVMYIAGILSDGRSVVEKWSFQQRQGRWSHFVTGSAPAIGTSAGPYIGQTAVVGGTYSAPPTPWYAPSITVLFETSAYGLIRSVSVDPEGRYLLFSTFPTGTIYQLDLQTSGATPTAILTTAEIPALASNDNIEVAQHATHGRVFIVVPSNWAAAYSTAPQPPVVLLLDANNDGLYESHTSMTLSSYISSLSATTGNLWSWPWYTGS